MDHTEEYAYIKSLAVERYTEMKAAADNAAVVKYGTECEGIGCLFPKAFKAVCKGKYGRYIRDVGSYPDYSIYEFDGRNRPLRLQKISNGKCTESIYWLETNGASYAVCFIADTGSFMGASSMFRSVYADERLSSFAILSSYRCDIFAFDYTLFPHIVMTEKDIYYNGSENRVNVFEYDLTPRGKIVGLKETEPEHVL